MDNLGKLTAAIAHDELAYHEALARLYELRDRYEKESAAGLIGSASRRHYELHGHRLAFGCCADLAEDVAKSEALERELLEQVAAEVGWPAPAA